MKFGTFEIGGDTYFLPPNEMLAKYIAISGYYGKFRLSTMTEILSVDARLSFAKQFDYLLAKDMITIDHDWISITKKGFKNYGAVLSLFYPNV